MAETPDKAERSGIQVIARAAAILRVLKSEPTGASLGQIAKSVDLPRSTVQRIVAALQEERLVISNPSGRGLRLGPEISALAQAMRNDVIETCRDLLVALAETTGETADLSVMRGDGMIFLDQVAGRSHRLRTVSSVGEVFPLTTPANGKACLAQLPREHAQNLITAEWQASGTKGDMGTLLRTLDEIKDQRLAYDIGEHTPGIAAIGFAFSGQSGDLYAISVPVPTTRLADVKTQVELALFKTATQLDRLMA
ncbi:MAG: IclR family transcriptional regulator [Sedimentitalea sp.]